MSSVFWNHARSVIWLIYKLHKNAKRTNVEVMFLVRDKSPGADSNTLPDWPVSMEPPSSLSNDSKIHNSTATKFVIYITAILYNKHNCLRAGCTKATRKSNNIYVQVFWLYSIYSYNYMQIIPVVFSSTKWQIDRQRDTSFISGCQNKECQE